jgi:proteic killer suppression protein
LTVYGAKDIIMQIVSIRDKRLRRYFFHGEKAGLPTELVKKLRFILTYLELMNDESALERIPHWRVHRLTGDLSGYWSLSVTRNWRLIFQVEDASIVNLDLVDYH